MEKRNKQKRTCKEGKDAPRNERNQKNKKTTNVYKPMHKIEKKSERGCNISYSGVKPALCELEQNKKEKKTKDQNYLPDSNCYTNPTNVAPTTSPITPYRN